MTGPERVESPRPEGPAPSAPPQPLRFAARLGLAARGLFYLLLAGLALQLALDSGAATDGRNGVLRRVSTAGQGLLYVGMAVVTVSFLLGRRTTGSEQQQRAGRVLVVLAAAGFAVFAVYSLLEARYREVASGA